jgi:hypothetical protein
MENIYKSKKFVLLVKTLIVLAAVFLLTAIVSQLKEYKYIGSDVYPANTMTFSGSGEVFVKPDIATFSFSITEESLDVSRAQEALAERGNEILEALEDFAIEEKDIRTTNYSINPKYEYIRETIVCITYPCPQPPGRQELTGYEVRQTTEVKLRDIDMSGEILSALGGFDVEQISGPFFSVDDLDEVVIEARNMAIEDAKKQAEILSKDLGVRLVRIVNFYENNFSPLYNLKNMGMGGAYDSLEMAPTASPSISAGENVITSDVSIVYEVR